MIPCDLKTYEPLLSVFKMLLNLRMIHGCQNWHKCKDSDISIYVHGTTGLFPDLAKLLAYIYSI